MGEPLFIPLKDVDPKKVYRGYVATADGLLHHTRSRTTGHFATGDAKWRPFVAPMPPVDYWAPDPIKRRTPQQRAESVARRIAYQVDQTGLPNSIFSDAQEIVAKMGREGVSDDVLRDIQAACWKRGEAHSFEECRAMAQLYLKRAEKEWEEKQSHQVTRTSPYTPVPGRGNQSAVSGQHGREQT